ncbi:YwhD family protein [Paenactinomyces guangxiensis]|uniref:YwhD family protein n=1 Tax=Paenactinomyces guangxiensis TaxID=1490290 RepID=A0A7W1WQB8_9BACL|nr:YwhD family protein [Paenactinomyces guangxiensis]MBA4494070.1 YwhD family protein [Paenactinomyces guangxiensis]MBH8591185.1 YwhD family protein [Paenactinomyces guangxiensis]
MANKKNTQFNIISNNSTTHGGYYTGTISLSNLSSVLIDGDHAKIDLGLIHAKSAVERGIKFTANKEEVPGGKHYWVVWVAVDRDENGPYYAGVTACPMIVDKENRRGWKNLAEHVNRMDDALKRRIKLTVLGETEKEALKTLLINHNPQMWENSRQELKEQLS